MNKYNWKNKEKFLADWKSNKNICSFLKSNGMTHTSGNYQTFKKWYNIHVNDLELTDKATYSNIFTKDSLVSRNKLKKEVRLLDLIKYECASCGIGGEWNGKKLNLQLEHKNGINNDNRIENLEYLCPNCHSQTPSFTGSNNHNKVFPKRIASLKSLNKNILKREDIQKISLDWNVVYYTALAWLRKYENKLKSESIYIDKSLETNKKNNRKDDYIKYKNHPNNISILMKIWSVSEDRVQRIIKNFEKNKEIHITIKDKDNMRINDINEVWSKKDPIASLSKNWQINKNAVKKSIQKLNLTHLHEDFKISEIKIVDIESRINDVINITNKKEVLALSKKWDTSVNGAKKWIRNNLPDKFKEIYDDKHLIKNQKQKLKKEKEEYIKSLDRDFNEEEAMSYLNTNKSGLFALISKYNTNLIDKLHSKHLCPKCNSKSRTSGNYQRCLVCNHNFTPNL
jgi:5-methylcytosine-specific restriction endonuclease McrA